MLQQSLPLCRHHEASHLRDTIRATVSFTLESISPGRVVPTEIETCHIAATLSQAVRGQRPVCPVRSRPLSEVVTQITIADDQVLRAHQLAPSNRLRYPLNSCSIERASCAFLQPSLPIRKVHGRSKY